MGRPRKYPVGSTVSKNEKNPGHSRPEDPLNLCDVVVSSLKQRYKDWTFNEKQKQQVLRMCEKENIAVIYIDVYNKVTGNFEYTEFTPVIFKKTPYGDLITQVDLREIRQAKEEWIYKDLTLVSQRK